MSVQFQWRPIEHWALTLRFAERVGWRNSVFIQVMGFCIWIYWNKKEPPYH